MKLSARNQLTGTVTSINEGAAIANVELDVNGQRLVASITVEAARELDLNEGTLRHRDRQGLGRDPRHRRLSAGPSVFGEADEAIGLAQRCCSSRPRLGTGEHCSAQTGAKRTQLAGIDLGQLGRENLPNCRHYVSTRVDLTHD